MSHPVEAESATQFGAYGDASLNIHSANFQSLPGVPSCCPRYENGSGLAGAFGVMYEVAEVKPFSFDLRLGTQPLSATLQTNEATTVNLQGRSVSGEFQHSVQIAANMITMQPQAIWNFLANASLTAGPMLGYIFSNTFNEQETLVDPVNNGTFENGLRTRNEYSGSVPNASRYYVGVAAGMQYRLPLNALRTFYAIPEAYYTIGLTPIARAMDWHVNAFSFGILFKYVLSHPSQGKLPSPPMTPPVIVQAPPQPRTPVLTAELAVGTSDSVGRDKSLKRIVVEDYIRTQYRPLLNYLFFSKDSASLPTRYHLLADDEARNFDYHKFYDYETLPLYYELLNIVGQRMQDIPRAKLVLVGCNDGSESAGKTLSRARVESVYDYLRSVWKIDPSRLTVQLRDLPEKPSTISDTDGAQENRRVELYSNDAHILEPIFTTDTAHIPKPGVVRFHPSGTVESGLSQWQIASSERSTKLKEFSGSDTLPVYLDWDLQKERESLLASLDTVHAVLDVSDRSNRMAESLEASIPVYHYTLPEKHREQSPDTIISRYSLILFDFDRGDLSESNRRIVDFVKTRILKDSKVSVFGYTDRIGNDEHNRTLSELRAHATERAIGITTGEVRGLGRSVVLFDNALPEGRFYSRTVTVVVTTPIKR